jgi:hypothetical protein
MTWAGRSSVNPAAAHGAAALNFGNTLLTHWLRAIASRMNRTRSAAIASVAQTIFTRRAGLWPSSQMMRQHTWKLLPWSRGSSMSARECCVRNACKSRCTSACRMRRPDGSVKQSRMKAFGSRRQYFAPRPASSSR